MPLTRLPTPRTPDPMTAPQLRWGILGPGWIADQQLEAMRRFTRQQVVAVGSRDMLRARAFADKWSIPRAYSSYAELVADPEVDVVYIATPHHLHLPHALLAIAANKHVLIEKPLGLDAHEARTIAAAAARAGVFCQEAMWTLFLPKYDVLRQLRDEGAFGDLHTVSADIGERFQPDHRILRADLAGGPMLDLGTYPITLATWFLGHDLWVAGAARTASPYGDVDGQFAALLTRGDAVASVSATVLDDTPTTGFVGGSEATLWLGTPFYHPGPFTVVTASGERLSWDEPRIGHAGLHFELAETARCIAEGRVESPLRPMAETCSTLAVMDAIRAELGMTFDAALSSDQPGRDA